MSINQSLNFRRSSNSKLTGSYHKQNVVRANSQLLKKAPLFYQDSSEALKSVYIGEQENPIKSKQRSKSKKKTKKQVIVSTGQSSTRRKNDINCQQILNLLKKRETHSALDNPIPSSISSSNISKIKPKMKKKKKTPIYVLPRTKAAYQVPNNIAKNGQLLSQSSSFIVFSDKQSASLNNTLLRSKVSHYKKTQMKPQKAAILIQKIWRGYMTRKLLQQYIKDQQPKIMEALKSLGSSAKHSIPNSLFASSIQQKNCEKLKQFFQYLNHDDSKQQDFEQDRQKQNIVMPQKAQLQEMSSIIQDTIKNVGFVDYNTQLLSSFQNSSLKALKYKIEILQQSNKKSNEKRLQLQVDKFEKDIQQSSKMLHFPNSSSTLKQLSHIHQLPNNECPKRQQISNIKDKILKQNKPKLVLSMPESLEITVKPESKRSSLNISEFFYSQQSNLEFIINNKIENQLQKHKKLLSQLLSDNQLTLPIYLDKIKMMKNIKEACFQGSNKFCKEIQRVLADLKTSSFYQTEEQDVVSQEKQEQQQSESSDITSTAKQINQSLRKPSSQIFNLQSAQPPNFDKNASSHFENKENQELLSNYQYNYSANIELIGSTSQTTFGNHQLVQMLKKNKSSQKVYEKKVVDQKKKNKVEYNVGIQQIKLYTESIYNQIQQCKQSVTELQFLCELLRKHSENGAQNMIQRCLIQFLVELITCQYPIQKVLNQILSIIKGTNTHSSDNQQLLYSRDRQLRQIILRWAKQLSKWDLGTIQQVSHVMESSSFLTEGNQQHAN